MKKIIETKQVKIVLLYRPLEKIVAERIRSQKQGQKPSLPCLSNFMTGWWHRLAVVTTGAFAVTALVSVVALHDTQGTVNNYQQTVSSEDPAAYAGEPSSRADFFIDMKNAKIRQWGPALVMPETAAENRSYGFDPQVKRQQEYLMALGFDLSEADGFKGPGTRRVIAEFRALYLPDTTEQIKDNDLTVVMQSFAKLAYKDAAMSGIDQGIVAAIRLASMRTGENFSYLMKLAATESSFNPGSEASGSSAAGLYQFTKNTWLNTLKRHGGKYRVVADYAAKIRYSKNRTGPFVSDEALLQHLLDLRKNPRLAALMAAETVRDHQHKLQQTLDREPSETDLYLAHFLGINNAIVFLQSMAQSPDMHAVELFPRAARNNQGIFHPGTATPRTVDEVYAFLDEKFSSRHYDDYVAN